MFVGIIVLMGLVGYPFVQELEHVSNLKKSKSDFQDTLEERSSATSPVRKESTAWRRLPSNHRNALRSLGFYPASLRNNTLSFSLKTLEGGRTRLGTYSGRWVLINFWATWCPPCRMEMPSLDKLQDQFPKKLKVLTINVEQTKETIRRFKEEYGFTLPVLMDSEGKLARRYGMTGLPESWLITPSGQPLGKLDGPLEWHNPPATETFETLFSVTPRNNQGPNK